jgi:acetyl esterase/lipase
MSVTTLTYGPTTDENLRSLDLYLSKESTSETPLIVFIHGGAWRSEDKSDYKDLATGFTDLGFSVASVNYR